MIYLAPQDFCSGDDLLLKSADVWRSVFARMKMQFGEVAMPPVAQNVDDEIKNRSALSTYFKAIRSRLEFDRPRKVVIVGGGCGSSYIPISYLNALYDSDLAVFWLDAHADLNTQKTSPSGLFHGMVLRHLLGDGEQSFIDILPSTISSEQIQLVGTRNLDPAEEDFIRTKHVTSHLAHGAPFDISKRAKMATKHRRAFIHLDLDVLNPELFPWVCCPTPGGLSHTS